MALDTANNTHVRTHTHTVTLGFGELGWYNFQHNLRLWGKLAKCGIIIIRF